MEKVIRGITLLILILIMLTTIFDARSLKAQIPIAFNANGDIAFQQAVTEGRAEPTIVHETVVYPLPLYPLVLVFPWQYGSTHTVSVQTPITDNTDPKTRYVFTQWGDGGTNPIREVTVAQPDTFTAYFKTQHYLTMSCSIQIEQTGGVPVDSCPLIPGNGWHDHGTSFMINTMTPRASDTSSYDPSYSIGSWIFDGWIGEGDTSYTGTEEYHQIKMYSPITEIARWRYPYHVYDDFFGWKGSTCWQTGDGSTRATPYDNGWMEHVAEVFGSGVNAYTVTGVGYNLDESNGKFEIRLHVTIFGIAPCYSVDWRINTFCGVGFCVKDLNNDEQVLTEVAREFYGNVDRQTFSFSTTVGLEDHSYRFWCAAEAGAGTFDHPDAETHWDFGGDPYFVYLRWLEIRPSSDSDFNLALVGMPDAIAIPETQMLLGESVEFPIRVCSFNLFSSAVELNVEGLPPGASHQFSNSIVTPPPDGIALCTLTVTTSTGTPKGYYTLLINGTTGDKTHTTAVLLRVGLKDWYHPQSFEWPNLIHVPINGNITKKITIYNFEDYTLNFNITETSSWINNINPSTFSIAPGEPAQVVTFDITGQSAEEFHVDSIHISSNYQGPDQDVYIPLHVVMSDVFVEPQFVSVLNPIYILSVSNTGNLGHLCDTAGFYLHQDANEPSFLFDGSVLLAFTAPNGDSLVGRYVFGQSYFLPERDVTITDHASLKTKVVDAEFNPTTPQAPLPWHHRWWFWTIRTKDYIFYSGAPDNNNEQYMALRYIQLYYNPPPPWWPDVTAPPSITPHYLGMALDINCPSDSGAWNYPGIDESRRMAFLRGYGGGANENYRMGMAQRDNCFWSASPVGPIYCCWPDPNTVIQDIPFAMHILRNDSVVYPYGGYDDPELYKWMSMPGDSIQPDTLGDTPKTDYNIVTTGRVIPAGSFPPTDTHQVAYAIVVTDRFEPDHMDSTIDMIMCGNVNRDNAVTVADVVYMISYLFRGGPEPWLYMGDANGDGQMNISDAVYLVGYMFKGGPPPQCSSL